MAGGMSEAERTVRVRELELLVAAAHQSLREDVWDGTRADGRHKATEEIREWEGHLRRLRAALRAKSRRPGGVR